MIISHRQRFLFVHIAKTGGSSIRHALADVRWIDPWILPQQVARRICQWSGYRIGSLLPRHASALTARETLPHQLFQEYFKFAVVRNPWDRLVSTYEHMQRDRQDVLQSHRLENFTDYCEWLLSNNATASGPRKDLVESFRRPQADYLTDRRGSLLVDFVARFERLNQDFSQLSQRIGFRRSSLPHRRRSHRSADYRYYYNDRLAELVGEFYRHDVETFGYDFCVGNQAPEKKAA